MTMIHTHTHTHIYIYIYIYNDIHMHMYLRIMCLMAVTSYLPTPPLGQDIKLGQFLSGV